MFQAMSLKFGSSPGASPLSFDVLSTTLFVGPNNSGKSLILREIITACNNGHFGSSRIIDNIEFNGFDEDTAETVLKSILLESPHYLPDGYVFVGRPNADQLQVLRLDAIRSLMEPNNYFQTFAAIYLRNFLQLLDGPGRISLVNDSSGGNLHVPQTVLQKLFTDDEKRESARKIICDAFEKYFVIDAASILGTLRISLSPLPPKSSAQERSLDDDALEFFSKCEPINATSDGVKAFIGLVINMIAGDSAAMLIDEPETFLHPPLAKKLGRDLSQLANDAKRPLFASTHSAPFTMGCIQAGGPINIVRLTYQSNVPTARLLPRDEIAHLMRDPLLRSTGVLNALFHEGVVVTEADSDRALYDEVNDRLVRFSNTGGAPDCLYLNAQNKQTTARIAKPLRKLGIPCAIVVDLDVINEGGTVWSNLMDGAFVPKHLAKSLADLRARVFQEITKAKINYKKSGVSGIIDLSLRDSLTALLSQMTDYGIFAVPVGELENWFAGKGVTGATKPGWLINAFRMMGDNPEAEDFLKPTATDIWDFVNEINSWIKNPNRKGLPN